MLIIYTWSLGPNPIVLGPALNLECHLAHLSVERVEQQVVVACPIDEVLSLLEDVALDALIHVGLHGHPHVVGGGAETLPGDNSSCGVIHKSPPYDLCIGEG